MCPLIGHLTAPGRDFFPRLVGRALRFRHRPDQPDSTTSGSLLLASRTMGNTPVPSLSRPVMPGTCRYMQQARSASPPISPAMRPLSGLRHRSAGRPAPRWEVRPPPLNHRDLLRNRKSSGSAGTPSAGGGRGRCTPLSRISGPIWNSSCGVESWLILAMTARLGWLGQRVTHPRGFAPRWSVAAARCSNVKIELRKFNV